MLLLVVVIALLLLIPFSLHSENQEAPIATTTTVWATSTVLIAPPMIQTPPKPKAPVVLSKTETERVIREYFADITIMIQVSYCESRFRQFNPDGTVLRGIVNSDDVGAMQINEYYHLEASKRLAIDIYTLKGNLAYARHLYRQSGTQPWSASAPCWSR